MIVSEELSGMVISTVSSGNNTCLPDADHSVFCFWYLIYLLSLLF